MHHFNSLPDGRGFCRPVLSAAALIITVFSLMLLYSTPSGLGVLMGRVKENSFFQEHFQNVLRADPEVHMNVTQLITSKGYGCEEHTVQTQDGYLLGVQRIPAPQRPAVLLQHGLLCSATNWITNLANESLAFLLADAGYDVWLGNSRGNTYSRRHISLSPEHRDFWAFSWDAMARYDVPAVVDYILDTTNQRQIYYIGHSQGTLMAFAAFSQNLTLASKVKHFFALGPVATVEYIKSPIRYLSYMNDPEIWFTLGHRDFLPSDTIIQILARTVCTADTRFLCSNVLFLLAGFDMRQLNQTRLPVYLSHTPAGTSVQDIIHFSQMVRHGKFQMFNYGSCEANVQHYNQCTPPMYNVSRMLTRVSLYYGERDWLADPKDVQRLIPLLSNLHTANWIEHWDHLDFIWGMDARRQVYDPIIRAMRQIDSEPIN